MAHVFLSDLKIGDTFDEVYWVETLIPKIASNGNKYGEAWISDKSRRIRAVIFVECNSLRGVFARCKGYVEEYNGAASVRLKSISPCEAPENSHEFIGGFSAETIEAFRHEYIYRLGKLSVQCSSPDSRLYAIHLLIESVRADNVLMRNFMSVAGGTTRTYGVASGALAQTIACTRQVLQFARLYGLNEEERAIACAAALLGRIGCFGVYSMDCGMPGISARGEMLGVASVTLMHLNSHVLKVSERLASEKVKVDSSLVRRLLHAAMATDETQKPKTKEALLVHSVFENDSRLRETFDFIDSDMQDGDITSFDPKSRSHFVKFA